MKRIFIAILLALILTFSSGANAYWCSAASESATGFGTSAHSVEDACDEAIADCESKTPHWQACSVTGSGA